MNGISGVRTLHELIYVSQCLIAPEDVDAEVQAIVQVSIRNNRQVALTGLLLTHSGWFLQVLEGPAEAVMSTYNRILGDPRHGESRVLSAGPAQAREFGDWNMCARTLSAADEAIVDALATKQGLAPDRLTGPQALRLLKAVRDIQDRTERLAS